MSESQNYRTKPMAKDYLEHAKEVNAIAGKTLRLETKDSTWISVKISLGLSLQAAELAGKGMLKALGYSVVEIRKQHHNHDLVALLKNVEQELQKRPEEELKDYHRLSLWTPTIGGTKVGYTIAGYLTCHFSKGASANPRSYFYPDELAFTCPTPPYALFVMVEHIIEVAEKVVDLIE